MARTLTPLAVALALVCHAGLAVSQDGPVREQSPEAEITPDLDPNRIEVAVLPGVTVSTETGFGFGALTALAGFEPGFAPYRWRLQASAFLSVREGPDGSAEMPVQSYWLNVDLPQLGTPWLRVSGKLGYRRHSAIGYFGLGGDATDAVGAEGEAAGTYHRYDRTFTETTVQVRALLGEGFSLFGGGTFLYTWLDPYPGSKLALDLAGDNGAEVRDLLAGATTHGELAARAGVLYDSRDHETSPTRGMLHDLSLEGGAGLGEAYGYGRLSATARFYVPLAGKYLVMATRAQADLLFGRPPFYELSRMGGLTPAEGPAGANGIRGVPAQRYHGEVKLLGNLELRSMFWAFELLDQRFELGAVAFADTGRVFAELDRPHPGLDGDGLGLAVGLGGGMRLQWGETFMARIDAAWSPDGVGFYALAGHLF
jgi:hypothetical protein